MPPIRFVGVLAMAAAVALTACQPAVVVTGPGSAPAATASPNAPAPASNAPGEEKAAYEAIAMLYAEQILSLNTGALQSGGAQSPPFATLALGDRLRERLGSIDEVKEKLLAQARGSFEVDLAVAAGSGQKAKRTSTDPTDRTVVRYVGTGNEPLDGLNTEFRGFTVDKASRTISGQIADKQGLVLAGGKNLFGKSKYAALPLMKGALADGFGTDIANGTEVSYRLTIDSAGIQSGSLALPFELVTASKTLPQMAAKLTLTLLPNTAAKTIALNLKGTYEAKAPGGTTVLISDTIDKTKTIDLTEAKANFLAATEDLAALLAK